MRIDPYSDRPWYRQLADILRARISSGAIGPGEQLPSYTDLQQEYDVSRDTARRALGVLRGEGLVETVAGIGLIARASLHTVQVDLQPGDRVTTRMPTPEERRRLGIPEGVPVMVITHAAGGEDLHAGDRTELVAPGGGE